MFKIFNNSKINFISIITVNYKILNLNKINRIKMFILKLLFCYYIIKDMSIVILWNRKSYMIVIEAKVWWYAYMLI